MSGQSMQALNNKIEQAIQLVEFGQISFTIDIQNGNPVQIMSSFDIPSGVHIMRKEQIKKQIND